MAAFHQLLSPRVRGGSTESLLASHLHPSERCSGGLAESTRRKAMETRHSRMNAETCGRRTSSTRSSTLPPLVCLVAVLTVAAAPLDVVSAFSAGSQFAYRRTRHTSTVFPRALNSVNPTDVRHRRKRIDHCKAPPSTLFVQSDDPSLERGLEPPFAVTLEGDYSYTDAIQRTLAWVGAAIVFGGGIWSVLGPTVGQEFFAGYLVEQSLSVDNLFVFLLLFDYFKVPLHLQDRVLNWGIFGAMAMRAIMIGIGAAAIHNFHAILLAFAAILIYGSAKFFFVNDDDDEDEDPSQNVIVKFSRGLFPSTDDFHGDKFFIIESGVRMATPLFICLIAVEISDIVFAVDSIPAVFGVTENPLIVFSSNMFAIMGLRSLYTILSKAATDLKYLEPAVAWVLGFIGVKMVLEYFDYSIPTPLALGVVATALSIGVGASVIVKQRELQAEQQESE